MSVNAGRPIGPGRAAPTRPRSAQFGVARAPPPPQVWRPAPSTPASFHQQQQQQPLYHQGYQQQSYQQPPHNPNQQYGYQSDYQHQRNPSQNAGPFMQAAPSLAAFNQFQQNEAMQQAVLNLAKDQMGKMSWLSMNRFRYYFHVNNSYVLKKLQIILLPYLQKRWSRERNSHEGEGNGFLPPSLDVNAPDLYIPLMAFVTYILMMGFIMGMSKAFTPEVLGATATWALAILILEVFLLRVGFAVVGSNASVVPPPLLDLIAYSSYKFVILVIDLAVWALSYHNSTMYWIISIFTGISMTVFMARTLQRAFVPRVDGSFSMDDGNKSTRQLFLVAVGFCQIPLCVVLGRSVAR